MYNPSTPDQIFNAEFVSRYGKQADVLLEAYALASATPLRLASSFDFTWDFTLYSEGFQALDRETQRVDFISVDRMINQPPLDPDYVSIPEFAKGRLTNVNTSKNKTTPVQLAEDLRKDCKKALELVETIDVKGNNTLMYEVADVKVWAKLGLYFSEKLKGAVALETYRIGGGETNKLAAVKHLEDALGFWNEVVEITRPIYKDMPLVHYSEQDGKHWKENDHLRFHWEKLIPEVLKDIEVAKQAVGGK